MFKVCHFHKWKKAKRLFENFSTKYYLRGYMKYIIQHLKTSHICAKMNETYEWVIMLDKLLLTGVSVFEEILNHQLQE